MTDAPTAEIAPMGGVPPADRTPSPWALRLALTYLVVLVSVSAVTRLVAERAWWATFLLYIPQVLYAAPALITVPVAFARRSRPALLVNLIALLLVAGPLMGWAASLPAGRARGARIRVLEYNVWGGQRGFERIRSEIDRYRPDVVVFPEALGWGGDDVMVPMSRYFEGWHSLQGGDMFLASRWPITEDRMERLGADGDRMKLRARVQAPFGPFWVVGAHFITALHGETLFRSGRDFPAYLERTGAVRRDQARDLLQWTASLREPVILAGDFNTPPAGQVYGELASRFRDAFADRGTGWGFTYPSSLPLLRIDYVWHSREWQTVRCETGGRQGSDHLPLFAELALK